MAEPLAIAFHNGKFLPLSEVHISPLDRGFLFGDGVYEVMPVYDGRILGRALHLDRLENSASAIALPVHRDREDWCALFDRLIAENGGGDMTLYLQLSRSGDDGRDHRFPPQQRVSEFMMASALHPPTAERYATGFDAVTCEDLRWARCDIKSTSLLPNVLARQRAVAAGATEAIMTRGGFVTEGAATSVAIVHGGDVFAPPEGPALLPGVTRRLTAQVAETQGIPMRERAITVDELRDADEVLLMSSSKEIMPIVRIDGAAVGTGSPGPVWRQLFDGYQATKLAHHAPAA